MHFLRPLAAAFFLGWTLPGVLPAVDDIQTGANGAGQNGQNATANATSNDATNFASATGGNATQQPGAGGNGEATAATTYPGNGASNARATAVGGSVTGLNYSGLTPYGGGHATAAATGSSSTAASLDVVVNANGGYGASSGSGVGGPGGNVTASAGGSLQSGGPLTVNVQARSGDGGQGGSASQIGSGGAAGTLSLGPITGASAGDATISLRAAAGKGGSFVTSSGTGLAARGADGRSVTLNNAVSGQAGGTLRLVQEAVGGDAGATVRGTGLPVAGEGRSTLDHTAASGTTSLQVESIATGGLGSYVSGTSSIFSTSPGGLGSAVGRALNASGRAQASATATGGSAPTSTGASGGPAAATAQADGQSTALGEGSSALATATGRAGANGSVAGTGGAGGRADADAIASTAGSGSTSAIAAATGGSVPSFAFTNAPPGGTAVATASGTATGPASLTVTATATGGQGAPASGVSSNPGGPATATASGATLGAATILARADAGFSGLNVPLGLATATGTGTSGSVTANASTGRLLTAVVPTTSVRAIATAPPFNSARSIARAEMSAGPLTFDPTTAPQAFAASNGTPSAAAVNAALSGNGGSAARFDTTKPVQLLQLSTAGGQAPAGLAGPVTLTCQLTCTAATNSLTVSDRRNLLLALLNPRVTGSGPDSLRLRILREGVTIHDVTLHGANSIRAYFTDHVLDLGAIPAPVTGDLDVDILLDLTASQPGAGFYATLFLGNASSAPVQTVDQWRVQFFGAGATNSGPAADDANPTGDGLSNLLKYALGYNPLLAYPAGTGVTFDTDSGHLRLSVERNPATSNIALTVEGTDDLAPGGSWTTTGLTIEQNTASFLRVSDDAPIAPGARRILRLRVTRF